MYSIITISGLLAIAQLIQARPFLQSYPVDEYYGPLGSFNALYNADGMSVSEPSWQGASDLFTAQVLHRRKLTLKTPTAASKIFDTAPKPSVAIPKASSIAKVPSAVPKSSSKAKPPSTAPKASSKAKTSSTAPKSSSKAKTPSAAPKSSSKAKTPSTAPKAYSKAKTSSTAPKSSSKAKPPSAAPKSSSKTKTPSSTPKASSKAKASLKVPKSSSKAKAPAATKSSPKAKPPSAASKASSKGPKASSSAKTSSKSTKASSRPKASSKASKASSSARASSKAPKSSGSAKNSSTTPKSSTSAKASSSASAATPTNACSIRRRSIWHFWRRAECDPNNLDRYEQGKSQLSRNGPDKSKPASGAFNPGGPNPGQGAATDRNYQGISGTFKTGSDWTPENKDEKLKEALLHESRTAVTKMSDPKNNNAPSGLGDLTAGWAPTKGVKGCTGVLCFGSSQQHVDPKAPTANTLTQASNHGQSIPQNEAAHGEGTVMPTLAKYTSDRPAAEEKLPDGTIIGSANIKNTAGNPNLVVPQSGCHGQMDCTTRINNAGAKDAYPNKLGTVGSDRDTLKTAGDTASASQRQIFGLPPTRAVTPEIGSDLENDVEMLMRRALAAAVRSKFLVKRVENTKLRLRQRAMEDFLSFRMQEMESF